MGSLSAGVQADFFSGSPIEMGLHLQILWVSSSLMAGVLWILSVYPKEQPLS